MYKIGDIVIFQGWKDQYGHPEDAAGSSLIKGDKLRVINVFPTGKFPIEVAPFNAGHEEVSLGFLLRLTEVEFAPPEKLDLERFM